MSDIFGQDIKLDDDMQATVSASGELILTQGVETGIQDIKIRLFTWLGNLFYDKEFGALIYNWIQEENTKSSRMGFEAEVVRRVRLDPRVKTGTSVCKVIAWDPDGITAELTFQFIDVTHPFNLVIEFNSDMEMVIKDVNPG